MGLYVFYLSGTLTGTQLVLDKCYNRYLYLGMKSELTEPVIHGSSTYTHQSGSHPSHPLGAWSWRLPQEGEKKWQFPRGLFHAEVAYWLLFPRETSSLHKYTDRQIDLIKHTAFRGFIWKRY